LSSFVQIDSGSFGKIYRSNFRDGQVAVKEITQSSTNGLSSLRSKMRDISYELNALILCDHPNVVKFFGAALEFLPNQGYQPSIAFVFELCENSSLHKYLFEKRRGLSVRQKVLVGSQVASGLAHLHSQSILHRDLNTRNVLLSSDMTAKIADFGCAVLLYVSLPLPLYPPAVGLIHSLTSSLLTTPPCAFRRPIF
jgi:serine/threonine protein kinase